MPIIDPTRVVDNFIALGIIFGIGFMIWSKMDKERIREVIAGIKKLFGRKEE